jgi:hypothetical protein
MGTRHVEETLHELDRIYEHDSDEEVESGTWLEEVAEEVVGHPHDAPNQTDLNRLSRPSFKCHVSSVTNLVNQRGYSYATRCMHALV